MVDGYFGYWGKAERESGGYHLLPYHCLDVVAVGSALLCSNAALRKKFTDITGLDESVVHRWLLLLLAMHDIGKYSESFQNLRPDLLEQLQGITSRKYYSVKHDRLGNLFFEICSGK